MWQPLLFLVALAKEAGSDEDMAEIVASEIQSLTEQIKELEEKFKIITVLQLKRIYREGDYFSKETPFTAIRELQSQIGRYHDIRNVDSRSQ